MIVPQFWAEGRVQHRNAGKQITVRRFGWSDSSQADAQAMADQRSEEALHRLLSGEKLDRREPKMPYNGADGVPIREEILDRRGETIVTRNSYGARCLNTPNVLFADVDFSDNRPPRSLSILCYSLLIGTYLLVRNDHPTLAGIALLIGLILTNSGARKIHALIIQAKGGVDRVARDRIQNFIEENPTWSLRVYRTPAGLRVLATHQLFDPADPAVAHCFEALGTDPIYVQMCLNQKCFRARVSAKPWRIGIRDHLRPRPGVWPVNADRLPLRNAWVAHYEDTARSFASCRWIASIGSGSVHPDVLPVQEWHDELSQANSSLPIA